MSGWAIEFQSTLPAWGRHCFTPQIPSTSGFQSTLPVWGATCMSWTRCTTQAYFNPHSPYGERPRRPSRTVRMRYFNPRSPRGERRADGAKASVGFQFQSTLPVWGATPTARASAKSWRISIHAPRVGSDGSCTITKVWMEYFNPRSPCGERPCWRAMRSTTLGFQSTLPVWGATQAPFP